MEFLLFLPVLILSIVVHEYAHGWEALRQGDRTAYDLGRLTFNPMRHIDPVGSVLVPVMLWIASSGTFLFGWAKPVPVDPSNFENYRTGDIRVSLAGIVANLLLAAGFTVLIVALVHLGRLLPPLRGGMDLVERMAWYGVLINLILAFFNLIPIPPLDGSHVLYHLLPRRLAAQYRQLGRYGFLILITLLFFVPRVFDLLLVPVSTFLLFAQTIVRLWT